MFINQCAERVRLSRKKSSPVTRGTVFSSSLTMDHTRMAQSLTFRNEDLRPTAVLMSDCQKYVFM